VPKVNQHAPVVTEAEIVQVAVQRPRHIPAVENLSALKGHDVSRVVFFAGSGYQRMRQADRIRYPESCRSRAAEQPYEADEHRRHALSPVPPFRRSHTKDANAPHPFADLGAVPSLLCGSGKAQAVPCVGERFSDDGGVSLPKLPLKSFRLLHLCPRPKRSENRYIRCPKHPAMFVSLGANLAPKEVHRNLVPIDEAPMTSFRNGTHAALVAVLISQRKALKLTLRTVAARMPKYLGWDHTTLVKIEKGRRNVSFVEARELARILGTNLAGLEVAVEALESASDQAISGKSRRR
jgi:hypothetical protein